MEIDGTKRDLENAEGGLAETRSMLKTKAIAEPGDTPARRAYYNLLEMTENWQKNPDQRPQLGRNIEREMLRLDQIRQSQH